MTQPFIDKDTFRRFLNVTPRGFSKAKKMKRFPYPIKAAADGEEWGLSHAQQFAAYFIANEEAHRANLKRLAAEYAAQIYAIEAEEADRRQELFYSLTVGHMREDWLAEHLAFSAYQRQRGAELASVAGALSKILEAMDARAENTADLVARKSLSESIKAYEAFAKGAQSKAAKWQQPAEIYQQRILTPNLPYTYPDANAPDSALLAFSEANAKEATRACVTKNAMRAQARKYAKTAKELKAATAPLYHRRDKAAAEYDQWLAQNPKAKTNASRRAEPPTVLQRLAIWFMAKTGAQLKGH